MRWGIGGVPRPGSRSAAKPLLYVDIDGVLNLTSPRDPRRFVERTVGAATVLISPEHGDWLRELSDHYQLVWATAWEHHANERMSPLLGLPDLPVVEISSYRRQDGDPRCRVIELLTMRKWAPILRHADGRPFAWVDDVIPTRIRYQAWPYRGILLVPVDPRDGLTRRHVERLLAWAQRR
jgi:hypothetical protein